MNIYKREIYIKAKSLKERPCRKAGRKGTQKDRCLDIPGAMC